MPDGTVNLIEKTTTQKVGVSADDLEKILKDKTQKVIVKEIRFGPQTDQHDYEFKKKHAIKFLQEGAKLKAFVFFNLKVTILFVCEIKKKKAEAY